MIKRSMTKTMTVYLEREMMSKIKEGSNVAIVEDGEICQGVVICVEDGMCDVDFPDGDEGTYPIENLKLMVDESIPTAPESAELVRLKMENAQLKKTAAKMKGIPDAKERTKIDEQPRVDELMKPHLATADGKSRKEMTEAEVVSVERTIRRYVKKGGQRKNYKGDIVDVPGGFKKGLGEDAIAYAKILLKRMGRDTENPEWDESIQVPGFSNTLKGSKHNL